MKKAQDELLDTIADIIDDFAGEQVDEAIQDEERPMPVDKAMEYITTLSDTPETWDKVENLFKAVMQEKWDEYLRKHQENYADDKAKEQTAEFHRRVAR